MYIDKFVLKNIVSRFTSRVNRVCLSGGAVDDVLVEIVEEVRKYEIEKRSQRLTNVSETVDLLTEQRDEKGRRRYKLGCVDDAPVMLPDKEGFWVPVNEV